MIIEPYYVERVKEEAAIRQIVLTEAQIHSAARYAAIAVTEDDTGEGDAILEAIEEASGIQLPENHPEAQSYTSTDILEMVIEQVLNSKIVKTVKQDGMEIEIYLKNGTVYVLNLSGERPETKPKS